MKLKYIFILCPIMAMSACSADNVLSSSGELYVSIACAISPIEKFIGDTVQFNLTTATNGDYIDKIERLNINPSLNNLTDKQRFTLIDTSNPLTMNSNGNLSREVSALMFEDKYIINKDAALYGQTLSVTYRVTTRKNVFKEITAYVKVLDYINNTVMIRYPLTDIKNNPMFFDPVENKKYTKDDYKANISKIEMVVYADASNKYFILNPASSETETLLKSLGINDYDASEMRNTQFEKDTKVNYYYVAKDELQVIAISAPVDKAQVLTDNVFAFITQDGKKGYLRAKIASSILNIASKMEGVIR